MARKDRAPTPPKRPVQAPQRRSSPASAADAERQRRLLYIVAGSGIAALVVVLGFLFLGGGGDKSEAAVLEDAGCTLKSFPAQANTPDHTDVPTLETKPKWNSFPPTSGPHFGQTAIFGSYDEEVPLVQTTHNLEHGAVVIHYGKDVPETEIEAIRAFYDDDPNGLIVAPLPQLGQKIALTALDRSRSDARQRTGSRSRVSRRVHGVRRGGVLDLRRRAPRQGAGAVPVDQLVPGGG